MSLDHDSLLFAACFDYPDITSVKLRLTNPVDGDPRAFEENVITFAGPALDLNEGQALTLPAVAHGWSADADYSEYADWTHVTISFATDDGGGFSSDSVAKSDLHIGEWTQIGQSSEGCDAPS